MDQTPCPYPTRSLPAQFWYQFTEWSNVWVSTKPLITEGIWPGRGLNLRLPNDTSALYPLLHELVLMGKRVSQTEKRRAKNVPILLGLLLEGLQQSLLYFLKNCFFQVSCSCYDQSSCKIMQFVRMVRMKRRGFGKQVMYLCTVTTYLHLCTSSIVYYTYVHKVGIESNL
jgi:hypothetical protein